LSTASSVMSPQSVRSRMRRDSKILFPGRCKNASSLRRSQYASRSSRRYLRFESKRVTESSVIWWHRWKSISRSCGQFCASARTVASVIWLQSLSFNYIAYINPVT
jgi:hypothetical protein